MESTTIDNFADFELINKNNYFMWSLYDRSGCEHNDEITKEGYAKWTSLTNPNRENITIKEYLKMYPSVSLVPYATALKLQQKHYEKKYNVNAMGTIAGMVDGTGAACSAISQLIISNYLSSMYLFYGSKKIFF